MENAKFTPGPWKATRREKRGPYHAAYDISTDWPRYGKGCADYLRDSRLSIATVLAHRIGSADHVPGEKPGQLANDDREGTQEANARLIAAAPDLEHDLSLSNDALNAAYTWIAKSTQGIEGASVIAAMLRTQHAENTKTLSKIAS